MPRTTFFEFLAEWETFKTEFSALKEKVSLLEEKVSKPEEKLLKVKTETIYPVPPDYQEIVWTILNKHFGIEYTPRIDIPSFEFSIIVPPKYNLALSGSEDRRIKVISNAEGQSGVKNWSEIVWNTFDQNTQTQIIADRE